MDSLKQLVASRLKAQTSGQHPDADALSAFAENALAPAARQSILDHVGVCADCRAILFLAAPLHADTQQTFAVKKSWAPFAVRWGAVAACVVIAAAVVGRHELTRTSSVAKMAPEVHYAAPTAPPATENTIAREKAPAELDALRDRQVAAQVAQPAIVASGHADAKAITAEPRAALDFKRSGEVSVAQSSADLKLEAQALEVPTKDLPIRGRDAAELVQLTPGAAPASAGKENAAAGGVVGENVSSYGGVSSNAPALRKDAAVFHGYVAGTISDATGAVISNAKVTAIGPQGEKTATSDPAGKFLLDGLATGTYSFKVDASGFRETELKQVVVLPDKPATVDIKLQAGTQSETVEVAVAAPAVAAQSDALSKDKARQTKPDMPMAMAQAQTQTQTQTEAQTEAGRSTALETVEVKKQKSARARKDRKAAPVAAGALALPVWQWSLSDEGAVQRSSDHGKTWQKVPVAEATTFRTIWAEGATAWAGGNSGALYHSTDSGQHWTQVVPAANGERLQDDITRIDFSDALHGTVSTANGQRWTTSDGGQTWQRKP